MISSKFHLVLALLRYHIATSIILVGEGFTDEGSVLLKQRRYSFKTFVIKKKRNSEMQILNEVNKRNIEQFN